MKFGSFNSYKILNIRVFNFFLGLNVNRFGTVPFEFAMVQGYWFKAICTQEIYLFYLLAIAKKTVVKSFVDIEVM